MNPKVEAKGKNSNEWRSFGKEHAFQRAGQSGGILDF